MTTAQQPAPAPRVWREPAGIAPRGTLVLLAGRGESAAIYQRFGTRLAADAYRVVAVPATTGHAEAAAADALATALADQETPRPLVLVGVDTGAPRALRLARRHAGAVDGVVLAGLPTRAPAEPAAGTEEEALAARTACPNHRLVLSREMALAGPADAERPPADTTPLGLPLLALHGGADRISPPAEALPRYRELGATSVVTVRDGRHDILNDVTHRSVAATLVLFLERLRLGAELPPLVEDATRADA
ncbi:lysophospholipase [Streptomyces sp. DSM 44915]|uniref:Lysophospholipase n=1 Tax=Streptomyces chisholmiae TaxID=3075540 RepID=A0ABU2JNR4_9ACTN|nr:lysophospholipase [Streptomyces sp. DSM 44915]MDT0266636.1 lysophospholipase [Streptomyces sp. DSM 44915]